MYNSDFGAIWDGIILEITVSFSLNFTDILLVYLPWNLMCSQHFNLRKSQIMMNCVLKES